MKHPEIVVLVFPFPAPAFNDCMTAMALLRTVLRNDEIQQILEVYGGALEMHTVEHRDTGTTDYGCVYYFAISADFSPDFVSSAADDISDVISSAITLATEGDA